MKKGWKIILFVALGVLLLFLLSLGFTQTKIFRNWLRGYILTNVQRNTNANLYLGDFRGSLFTGLTIRGASLTLDGQDLFAAEVIELRYNPLELFQKHIALGRFALIHPKFTFHRSSSGEWNLQRLLKAEAEPSRAPFLFPWKIALKSLEIVDGELSVIDSTRLETVPQAPELASESRNPYAHIALRDVDALITASISAGETEVTVTALSAESPSFEMRIEKFSTSLNYSRRKTQIKDLTLVTTGSTLKANAEFDSLDLAKSLNSLTLRDRRVRLNLDVPRMNLSELEKFIPGALLLSGTISLRTVLSGTFGELYVEQCALQTAESELKVTGFFQDLLDSRKRTFDLAIQASSSELSQVQGYLPSLSLLPLARLGKAEVSGYFKGKPEDFEASIKANLHEFGKAEITGRLDLRTSVPEYQARFVTEKLNLAPFLSDQEHSSSLSSSGEISGRGTTVKDLALAAEVTVDSSEISQLKIGQSRISIAAAEQRITGEASLRLDGASTQLMGTLDLRDEAIPIYEFSGEFSQLDLARLTLEEQYQSNLNGSLTVSGRGKDLALLSGMMALNFKESTFRGRKFEGSGIKIVMDQQQSRRKSIVLESPLFDARIEGAYHLKPFYSLVKYQVGNVLRSLKERLPSLDTTRAPVVSSGSVSRQAPVMTVDALPADYFDFNYDITVKDLTPLAVFLGDEDFDGKGTVKGFVVGDAADLLLGINATVDNIVYRGKKTRLLLTRTNLILEVDHLSLQNVLDVMNSRIDASASTWVLNGLRVTNLGASVDYSGGIGSFSLRGVIDSVLNIETNGNVDVTPSAYVCHLNNLSLDYQGYYWDNRAPILATIDSSGLSVKHIEMGHGGERLILSGSLRANREMEVDVKAQDVQLSDLYYFWPQENERKFTGIGNIEGKLAGPLHDPTIRVSAKMENLKYGAVSFGNLQADAEYSGKKSNVNIELLSPSEARKLPELSITGTLPIDLAFTTVQNRFPEGELDLQVQARELRLDLLDPFIPVFDEIGGILNTDVRLGGTTKRPLWWGSVKLEHGTFVFAPNGLRYYVSGSLEPKEERILISKLVFRSDPKDEETSGLTVTGELSVKPLYIESFDLSAKGQVLILKETVRRSHSMPYGNLLISIGPTGLQYSGSFDQSSLSGSVLIKTMSVTFPPVTFLPSVLPTRTYTYTVIDDTSRPVTQSEGGDSLAHEFSFGEENHKREELSPRRQKNPFDRLIEGTKADVSIETDGPAQLRMIFAYSTGEELFSEVRGKLLMVKDEFGTRFLGDVEATPRSYYYFYKRFDATGKLKFSGPLTNPEMDITAKYEGFRQRPLTDTLRASSAGSQKEQRVVITLTITGTRISPKLGVAMTVDGQEWSGDVQSDAIAFIVSGKFRDDLTTPERNQIATGLGASVTSTVITGVTSSLFSGVLTDFLRREFGGFIRQAELSYGGGSVYESADLRVTGEIGRTVFRVGGRVFTDIGNANVNVQMPVGPIIGAPALENLIIELERKVEGSSYATDEKKLTNAARVYYRIGF